MTQRNNKKKTKKEQRWQKSDTTPEHTRINRKPAEVCEVNKVQTDQRYMDRLLTKCSQAVCNTSVQRKCLKVKHVYPQPKGKKSSYQDCWQMPLRWLEMNGWVRPELFSFFLFGSKVSTEHTVLSEKHTFRGSNREQDILYAPVKTTGKGFFFFFLTLNYLYTIASFAILLSVLI